jgi:signal transduction histidine kinase
MLRRRSFPPYAADTVLALALTVPTVAGLLGDKEIEVAWWVVGPLAALTTLPLAARRYRPLAVFVVTVSALVLLLLSGVDTFSPGVLVATYTLAAHCARPPAIVAAVVALLVLAPAHALSSGRLDLGSAVPTVVSLVAAWLLGDNLRTRRAYLRELEEKAERLEREREENERRAAAEEQARIARELHDVIAHNVSVMTVQAAGAREVFDTNPVRARDALASIEATGREALAELRRLLGVARTHEDGSASLAPQPGLERLELLVDQVRAAGLVVDVRVEGERLELPVGVDLSAYRVVQEALTNTLKHAFAQRAWVAVRYADDGLTVEVLDDGAGPPRGGPHNGRGLIGMQERVGLFRGELQTGIRPEGGFRVWARFPLAERET